MADTPFGPFEPGESVRFSLPATVDGVPFSPTPQPTLTIWGPDGTLVTPSVSQDGTGQYHADWVIPVTARAGTWWFRWRSIGADPSNTGSRTLPFIVSTSPF